MLLILYLSQALLELVWTLCPMSNLEWVNPPALAAELVADPPHGNDGLPEGKGVQGNEDLGDKLKREVDKRALKEAGWRNPPHKRRQGALIWVFL